MPTYKEIITDAKDRMSKTREAFKREMQSMRAGRANPQILDRITVDYYGVQTPLNQMGNISAPEPRMLVISLWDAKAIPAVEKAIQKSDLGLNPSNDGHVVRLIVPELNEERRKELTKLVRKTAEDAKVASAATPWSSLRSSRRTAKSPRTISARPRTKCRRSPTLPSRISIRSPPIRKRRL